MVSRWVGSRWVSCRARIVSCWSRIVQLMSVHFETGLLFSYCAEVRPLTFSVAMWIFALDQGFLFGQAGGCPAIAVFWLCWLLAGVPWSAFAALPSVGQFVPWGGGSCVSALF